MVAPGFSFSGDGGLEVRGFRPLEHARGILLANKQISNELIQVFWSNNTLLIPINEEDPLDAPGQSRIYRKTVLPALAKVKKIELVIRTERFCPYDKEYQGVVAKVRRAMNQIVRKINQAGNDLDSLTVRYSSSYPDEIDEMRSDCDGLAANKDARPVWAMDPRTDKMQMIKHDEMKGIFLVGDNIADAIIKLTVPVKTFRIFGDVSSNVIERLHHKFGIELPKVDDAARDKYGQKLDEQAEKFKRIGSDSLMGDMVKSFEQIFSTRCRALRFAIMLNPYPDYTPAGEAELERRMARARMA
jgi:hypothetical protein